MKPTSKGTISLAVTLVLVTLVLVPISLQLYRLLNSQLTDQHQNTSAIPASSSTVSETVVALGRIQPKDKVINLSGSSYFLQNVRVAQILVKEGDRVQRGQVIAILDNLNKLRATLEQAKQSVKVAQARLAQVKTGEAKKGEIAAQEAHIANLEAQFQGEIHTQKAKIARLEAEFKNAQAEYSRFEQLYQKGAISASEIDSKKLKIATFQEQINEEKAILNKILSSFPKQIEEAKAILAQIKEVRPVDVRFAQSELEKAISAVAEAEADFEFAYVRAPGNGQILRIHTFPGESISSKGIVDLFQTQQMYVVAEVYETDISKIRLGQMATVTSSAFPEELNGNIENISSQVEKKNVFNNDPTLDMDARVVEVKIRLDSADSKRAASLINLQVEVKIYTNS